MLEIYDCTLREGEQADGANFNFLNRIELCKRLDDFGVDYIEIGWPLVSKEIFDSFKEALAVIKKAKIVAFGSTSIKENVKEDDNLNSIILCGAEYACIFGKSCEKHVEKQLKITKEQNLKKIEDSITYLKNKKLEVFYDAEHYFNAFKENQEYAIETLIAAAKGGASRLILCDTTGGIFPEEAVLIVKKTKELLNKNNINVELGVHFHDDCALALANTLSCLPYIKQVQGTINGIGERIGNLNFSEFLPVYKKMGNKINTDLTRLKDLNEFSFRISGLNIPEKRAFVGDTAFAHKGGVHIDAVFKGASYEHAAPEDFGNKTVIILNTLGGRSSVVQLAKKFGYELDKNDFLIKEKIQKFFDELKIYEKNGYKIGTLKSEQFLLLDKYFGRNTEILKINEWEIKSQMKNKNESSYFRVKCNLDDKIYEGELEIDGGPIDAAFKTLKKIISEKYPEIKKLELVDFKVSIAMRHGEESAVRTEIIFQDGEKFSCVGVNRNILGSAIEALEKGFRYFLLLQFS